VLQLYSESLGFITVAEVLALAPGVSEGGASKRVRIAEGSDPLDFYGSSLMDWQNFFLFKPNCIFTNKSIILSLTISHFWNSLLQNLEIVFRTFLNSSRERFCNSISKIT
jgi:hypothetical protein